MSFGLLVLLRKLCPCFKYADESLWAGKASRQQTGFHAALLNSCETADNSLGLVFMDHRWPRLIHNEEMSCAVFLEVLMWLHTGNKNYTVLLRLREAAWGQTLTPSLQHHDHLTPEVIPRPMAHRNRAVLFTWNYQLYQPKGNGSTCLYGCAMFFYSAYFS